MAITKVLIANRGEIAVRIIRAARDGGIGSVAAYADPDSEALFVELADEAFALGGTTPTETYLDIDKLISIAERAGADAVHPGYGFLAENADFARRVIEAGLTWIGPPPEAIESLGDKVKARHIATKVGAPQVPGTPDPVSNAAEAVAFAREYGLPVAIKAAFGGGGRGLKVARTLDEIPELFDSATREAITAFGRGECFLERYLDKPRHVETQCLADTHGNVVVVSTRDCSLQRRHQKLVEEAPAPFLSDEQVALLYVSSKAILREAGYVGAGTCEFLVGTDGTVSFLEVNTRLQVEHPVSEEVTGLDLVREMFRISDGEELGYDDPVTRGHSIEFRINAEDPGLGFLPAPGPLTTWRAPEGPGVRVDAGYHSGLSVPAVFDSLVAKVIVSGADRRQAIERSRRALRELVVEGMPTVQPFHQAVLEDPAFVASDGRFAVHTRWIETEFNTRIPAYTGSSGEADNQIESDRMVMEAAGRRIEVRLPRGVAGHPLPQQRHGHRDHGSAKPGASLGSALLSPMQCTIVKVMVADGDTVEKGQNVAIIEAMKMEQPLTAHRSGVISGLRVRSGTSVPPKAAICEIVDG